MSKTETPDIVSLLRERGEWKDGGKVWEQDERAEWATDEAMAAERFPTPRDQVRFLASVPRGRSTTAVCQLCKLSGVGSNPIASTASDG